MAIYLITSCTRHLMYSRAVPSAYHLPFLLLCNIVHVSLLNNIFFPKKKSIVGGIHYA